MDKPNVIDLFCGCGGLSKGFEEAGYNIIGGFDNNDHATDTWDINHSGDSYNVDITELTPDKIREQLEDKDIDVIIGGPPCKDFTKANKVIDLGRNNLVILFTKIVSSLEPDVFLIENVRQIETQYSDVLEEALDVVQDDYSINYRYLDAADYGVPQHRIRTFVLGIKDDKLNYDYPRLPRPTHGPDSNTSRKIVTAGDAIGHLSEPDNPSNYEVKSKHAHLLEDIPPGMNYSFYTEKMGHPEPKFEWRSKFSDYLYKTDPEKPVRTIKAEPGAASGPFHWNSRKFTEQELKLLQGFNDSFKFSTDSYTNIVRMIGNSVPPKQSYVIARAILNQTSLGVSLLDKDDELDIFSRKRTSSEEYKQKAKKQIDKLYD